MFSQPKYPVWWWVRLLPRLGPACVCRKRRLMIHTHTRSLHAQHYKNARTSWARCLNCIHAECWPYNGLFVLMGRKVTINKILNQKTCASDMLAEVNFPLNLSSSTYVGLIYYNYTLMVSLPVHRKSFQRSQFCQSVLVHWRPSLVQLHLIYVFEMTFTVNINQNRFSDNKLAESVE